jgi:hypothetical protein
MDFFPALNGNGKIKKSALLNDLPYSGDAVY